MRVKWKHWRRMHIYQVRRGAKCRLRMMVNLVGILRMEIKESASSKNMDTSMIREEWLSTKPRSRRKESRACRIWNWLIMKSRCWTCTWIHFRTNHPLRSILMTTRHSISTKPFKFRIPWMKPSCQRAASYNSVQISSMIFNRNLLRNKTTRHNKIQIDKTRTHSQSCRARSSF